MASLLGAPGMAARLSRWRLFRAQAGRASCRYMFAFAACMGAACMGAACMGAACTGAACTGAACLGADVAAAEPPPGERAPARQHADAQAGPMICERLRAAATERCRPVARLRDDTRDARMAHLVPAAPDAGGDEARAR